MKKAITHKNSKKYYETQKQNFQTIKNSKKHKTLKTINIKHKNINKLLTKELENIKIFQTKKKNKTI